MSNKSKVVRVRPGTISQAQTRVSAVVASGDAASALRALRAALGAGGDGELFLKVRLETDVILNEQGDTVALELQIPLAEIEPEPEPEPPASVDPIDGLIVEIIDVDDE